MIHTLKTRVFNRKSFWLAFATILGVFVAYLIWPIIFTQNLVQSPTITASPDAVESQVVNEEYNGQPLATTDVPLATEIVEATNSTSPQSTPPIPTFPAEIVTVDQNEALAEAIPNERIFVFKAEATETDIRAYLASVGAELLDLSVIAGQQVARGLFSASVPTNFPESAILLGTQANYYMSRLEWPHPEDYSQQWYIPRIHADSAWTMLGTIDINRTIRIAIIDSGICAQHPDLQGISISGRSFGQGNDSDFSDGLGHGCAVTGIIAANMQNHLGMVGLVPRIEILALKVLGSDGTGTYFDLASALSYAREWDADIVNMSIGGTADSALLTTAVEDALNHGLILVAAGGNTSSQTVLSPARIQGVIAVGSYNANGQISSFSSRGIGIDLYAPGEGIYSLRHDNNDYAYYDGTSFASPIVTGIIGLEILAGRSLDLSDQWADFYLPSATPIPSPIPSTETPIIQSPKVDPLVFESIENNQSTRVIVNLALPPVAQSNRPLIAQAVENAETDVINALGADAVINFDFTYAPAIALTISSSESLNALIMNDYVLSIQLDRMTSAQIVAAERVIGANLVHDMGYTGQDVLIGVLDTAIGNTSELSGVVIDSFCTAGNDCPGDSEVPSLLHGTLMASIIHEVAPQAHIINGVVLANSGQGYDSYWIKGLDEFIANYDSQAVDIISMSIATDSAYTSDCSNIYPAAASAILQLRSLGVVVVASTGNLERLSSQSAPSCIEGTLSVTASYDDEVISFNPEDGSDSYAPCSDTSPSPLEIACFANRSYLTDLAAPGAEITLSIDSMTVIGSGTSQAAALTSGSIALLLEANPNLSPLQITALLRDTGTPILDNGLTFPRLNIATAVVEAENISFSCEVAAESGYIDFGDCQVLEGIFSIADVWPSGTGWGTEPNPCLDWAGITCISGRVVSIILPKTGITSLFPDLTGLDALQRIALNGNNYYGEISPSFNATILPSLNTIALDFNRLTTNSSAILDLTGSSFLLSQTLPPTDVNAQATSPTQVLLVFHPPLYQTDGFIEARCGTSESGPYDVLVAQTQNLSSTAIRFANAVPDTDYYCVLFTHTEANSNQPTDLISLPSEVVHASTSPEGIRDGQFEFSSTINDTFVASSNTVYQNEWRSTVIIGRHFDEAGSGATFTDSIGLFDVTLLPVPENYEVSSVWAVISYYATTGASIPIGIHVIEQDWDPQIIYPSIPIMSTRNYALRDNVLAPYNSDNVATTVRIPLDPEIIPAIYDAGNYGIAIRHLQSPPTTGMAMCSANLVPPLCSAGTEFQIEINYLINTAPPAPSNPQPPDNAIDQETTVDLDWDASIDEEGNSTRYTVSISDNPEMNNAVVYENLTDTVLPNQSFNYSQHVYWRVDASDEFGTTIGEVWHLQINVCDGVGLTQYNCNVLRKVAHSTLYESWTDRGGWLIEPVCSWLGVTCSNDGTGRLLGLNLANRGLSGELPSEFATLVDLENIDFSNNSLTGSVPNLSGMRELKTWNLSGNNFYGVIPNLNNMPALESINFAENQLSGPISPSIFALPSIQVVQLSNNNLTSIPFDTVRGSSSLEEFYVDHNRIEQTFDSSIFLAPNLRIADFSFNALYGTIDNRIASSSLVSLNINNNGLQVDEDATALVNQLTGTDWFATETLPVINVQVNVINNTAEFTWAQQGLVDANTYFGAICIYEGEPIDGLVFDVIPVTTNTTTVTGLYYDMDYDCYIFVVNQPSGEQKNRIVAEPATLVNLSIADSGLGQDVSNPYDLDLSQLPQYYQIPSDRVQEGDPLFECSSNGGGIVWVKSSSTTSSGISIRIIVSSETLDPVVNVYEDTGSGLVPVAGTCNDNYGTTGGSALVPNSDPLPSTTAITTVELEAGVDYYIAIRDTDGRGPKGIFNVAIMDASFRGCGTDTVCSALTDFANQTVWWEWRSIEWFTSNNYCNWNGITCDNTANIVAIELPYQNLQNELPVDALSRIPSLTHVNFEGNRLVGNVGEALRFTNLSEANLAFNGLYTSDPATAAFLDELQNGWSTTQAIAPSLVGIRFNNITANSAEMCWIPISYSESGYYEIGFAPPGVIPTNFAMVADGLSTNCHNVTGLPEGSTVNIWIRTVSTAEFYITNLVSDPTIVSITTLSDLPPSLVNDVFFVEMNDSLIIGTNPDSEFNPLANDSDLESTALRFVPLNSPSNGTFVQAGNNVQEWTYTPARGWSGIDSVDYSAVDSAGQVANARIWFVVYNQNDDYALGQAPVAVTDTVNVNVNSSISIDVLINDYDPNNDPLTILGYSQPLLGSIMMEDGLVKYTSPHNFVGNDVFNYYISDGTHVTVGMIVINVIGIIDGSPSANHAPTAVNDEYSHSWNARIQLDNFLSNDTDFEGDAISLVTYSQPAHGELRIGSNGHLSYKPFHHFVGQDYVLYVVEDALGARSTAWIILTITEPGNNNDTQVAPSTTEAPTQASSAVPIEATTEVEPTITETPTEASSATPIEVTLEFIVTETIPSSEAPDVTEIVPEVTESP